ncbi:MAG TPA: glycoside hydrolase family 44 protein [Candidatus Acidoferrum sp.]|nr:glycoside hydrolase family 44 protein [Candidatus Acidoferrum sp.]
MRADQIIYDDALQNSWQDWSWNATRSFNYTGTYVNSGSASVSVTITSGWGALSLWHSAFDSTPYTNLTFVINGGASGGQQLQIYAELSTGAQPAISLPTLTANSWQRMNFSLSALGVANQPNFIRFSIQDRSGSASSTFYLDDIVLQAGGPVQPGTNSPVTVAVDAALDRHPISPQIYGTAFATSNQLADLNFPINRSGGNSETRYNWQLNAHNHAADWYFESLDDGSATPGASADDFVSNSQNGGAQAMITIPMIGWMPRLGSNRGKLSSYSIGKYGPQIGNDASWMPDAGNGTGTNTASHIGWLITTNGPINPTNGVLVTSGLNAGYNTTNDPNDANFFTNVLFQQGYVQHLTNRWGVSTNGGVRYYLMDNEHSLWQSTHMDVHPVGPTMQEIWNDMLTYGRMVKSNDANALVLGPEEWGWPGYLYSGYDQQWSGQQHDWSPAHYPDRAANGGWDYGPWLLKQFQNYNNTNSQRLLDYFTLHCYPQENGVGGNGVDATTAGLRNQSTRQFWDTNYVDPSWINSIIGLIPRMKSWVATNYPGTKIGITEYNWGAEAYQNGATAQADILGIFGREGLDLSTRWTTPDPSTPTYKAMKIYRNYDNGKSTFGDTSVRATVPNPDNLSAFAAVRSTDGKLTVMVINKDIANVTPVILNLTNAPTNGTAQVWQLATNSITHLPDTGLTNGVLNQLLPPASVTLFVLPGTTAFNLRFDTNLPPNLKLWLNGQAGRSYVLQCSSNLTVWTPVATNALTSNSFAVTVAATNARAFYRGVLSQP